MLKLVWFIVAICLTLGSCEEDETIAYGEIGFAGGQLLGCWTHSFEENQGNPEWRIYRPCDYKEYSPSRYRHRLELMKNAQCTWLHLAANDAHYMVNGSWIYDEENQVLEIFNKSGKSVTKYRLIEVGDDFLKLELLD